MDVAPFYGMGFFIALSVYFFKYLPVSSFLILIIQLVVGSVVFFLICRIGKVPEYYEIKSIIGDYILNTRKKKRC